MLSEQTLPSSIFRRQICLSRLAGMAAFLSTLWFAPVVRADVLLNRADIESLLNRVELLPNGRSARPARLSDFLGLGDTLRTAAASRAELRFNDGSLARMGELATFRFVPNTRNFQLSNGTVLLLIPPGQGRSTIHTPNAITGIQGSAVVCRYIEETNTTVVMALTDNPSGPIMITNLDGTQGYGLESGQMALVQDGLIQVLEFDIRLFYESSTLIKGLGLDSSDFSGEQGDPLNAVREETLAVLENAEVIETETFINPSALSVSGNGQPTEQSWFLNADGGYSRAEGPAHNRDYYSTVTGSSLITTGRNDSPSAAPTSNPGQPRPSINPPPSAVNPTPVQPPINPTPLEPTPANPTPVEPTPVEPTPVNPTPVEPTPVEPTPVNPTPVEPTPVEPTPGDPTTQPIDFPDKADDRNI